MNDITIKNKIDRHVPFKIEAFRKHIRHTKLHKHKNYFEIIFFSEGRGKHLIDEHTYSIKPSTVFVLKKDQWHAWDIQEAPDGYVIIVKDQFVLEAKDQVLKQLFHLFWQVECLYLSREQGRILHDYFRHLEQEHKVRHHFSTEVVEGLMKCILAKLLETREPLAIDDQHLVIYGTFIDHLMRQEEQHMSVTEYAQLQSLTVAQLNQSCEKVVSKPAKSVIDDYILSEAKRYLKHTNHPVREIAFSLGFNDASYFGKFFKHKTGLTPKTYRSR